MSKERIKKLLSLATLLWQERDLWGSVERSFSSPQERAAYRTQNSTYDDSLRHQQDIDTELRELGCSEEMVEVLIEYASLLSETKIATVVHGVASMSDPMFGDLRRRRFELEQKLHGLGIDLTTP